MQSLVYVFGPFSYDAASGLLLRNGHRLPLNWQASTVLSTLLRNAGTVVSREDLQRLLWGDSVAVDFDRGINRAVSYLRTCLRDNAQTQRYIQTIPKRGYRFSAPVESRTEEAEEPAPAGTLSIPAETALQVEPEEQSKPSSVETLVVASLPVPPQTKAKFASVFALVIALLLAGQGCWWLAVQRNRHLSATRVYFQIRAIDPALSPVAAQIQGQLLADFASMKGLRFQTFPKDGNPSGGYLPMAAARMENAVFLMGTLEQHQAQATVDLTLTSRDGAELGHLRYAVDPRQFGALHEQVQQDLYVQYLYRLASNSRNGGAHMGAASDPVAYADYLQAAPNIASRNPELLQQAVASLRDATRRDAAFTPAGGRLAYAILLENLYSAHPDEARYREAVTEARRVSAVDPGVAEAHAVVGFWAFHEIRDLQLAESELEQALRLEPGSTQIRSWLALLLSYEGRTDQSLEQIRIARSQDDNSACLRYNELLIEFNAGRFHDMKILAEHGLAAHPEDPVLMNYLGFALWQSHRYEPAVQQWLRSANAMANPARVRLEQAGLAELARGGALAYARSKAAALNRGAVGNERVSESEIAAWYALADQREQAIEHLQRAYRNRDSALLQMKVSPEYASLRTDARFQRLVQDMHLNYAEPAFQAVNAQSIPAGDQQIATLSHN